MAIPIYEHMTIDDVIDILADLPVLRPKNELELYRKWAKALKEKADEADAKDPCN